MDIDTYRQKYLDFVEHESDYSQKRAASEKTLVVTNAYHHIRNLRILTAQSSLSDMEAMTIYRDLDSLESSTQAYATQGTYSKDLQQFTPTTQAVDVNLGMVHRSHLASVSDIAHSREDAVTSLDMQISNESLAERVVSFVETVERIRVHSPKEAEKYDRLTIPIAPIVAKTVNQTFQFSPDGDVYRAIQDASGKFYLVPDDVKAHILSGGKEELRFEPWHEGRFVISSLSEQPLVSERDLTSEDVQDVCLAGTPALNGCCADANCVCGPPPGLSPGLEDRYEEYERGLQKLVSEAKENARSFSSGRY